jgi:hypothetical protein
MKTAIMVLMVVLVSCVSTRKRMDSLLDGTRQDVLMRLGIPDRTVPDNAGGEVMVFDKLMNGFGYGAPQYYRHTFVYLNSSGSVYYWMIENSPVAATQLDINLYIRTPTKTTIVTGY